MWVEPWFTAKSHDSRSDLRVVFDFLRNTRRGGVLVRALSLRGYGEKPLSPKLVRFFNANDASGPFSSPAA